MRLNEYAEWTENTCAKLDLHKLEDALYILDILHMLLGISTEAGELQDAFKKKLAYNREIDWVNVEEELGDLLFYIASFCRITGLDLEKIIETNVAKLETRYPEKFTQFHANNRDLVKERDVLEK